MVRKGAASLVSLARGVWSGVQEIVYPPTCIGCGARVEVAAAPLCARCLRRPERADAAEVDACLARLSEEAATLDFGFALWLFDKGGLLQEIQHMLKYGNRPSFGLVFGQMMGSAYAAEDKPLPDLIVPIPLHRLRLYERGYNQSTMLARGLAEALGVGMSEEVISRRRSTRSQTSLSRDQRWTNVREAFSMLDAARVEGRQLLLVDDVLTTGATAAAAAGVLRAAGAAGVGIATLAHAR